MARAMTRVLAEITDLRAEMVGVRGEVTHLRSEFHEFRAETRADIRHLGERIDGVNTRLDTVIDSVARLRTDFAGHSHD